MLDASRWDVGALAGAWRVARPFPHVVLDGVVGEAAVASLCEAVAREPHAPNHGEIGDIMASGDAVAHPALCAFQAELGAEPTLAAVRAITGKAVASVELRSYAYLPGSYLLPHTDWRPGVPRLVAYAF